MSSYNLPLPPPPPPTTHAVLTKSDLAASQSAYATLLTTAKAYRLALASLSTAASAFGAALESCARLKEARADSLLVAPGNNIPTATTSANCTADSLLAAAGVQHLVANHEQILSETVYRSFEVPLLHELDKWRRAVDDEDAGYRACVSQRSAEIRKLERDGLKLHKQRGPRDVAKFRGHLVELTTKLDGLTALHGEHARTLLRESQDTSVRILEASCSLVRAEVDIFESLARKGWSGGGLDEILEKGTDLFAADDHHASSAAATNNNTHHRGGDDAKLFSILPPGKSILADTDSDTTHLHSSPFHRGRSPAAAGHHYRADSLGVASEPGCGTYLSLTGAVSPPDADAASIFSADFNAPRPPRMTRPFSPMPVRVAPEDVMGSGAGSVRGGGGGGSARGSGGGGGTTTTDSDEEDARGSPATVKDGSGFGDEHAWDTGSDGPEKRMSTAASDPDERERRWQDGGSGDETA